MGGRDHAVECLRCAGYCGGLNDLICCNGLTDTEIVPGLREELGRMRESSEFFRNEYNRAELRRVDNYLAIRNLLEYTQQLELLVYSEAETRKDDHLVVAAAKRALGIQEKL